jgi:hypothetical protein
MFLRIYDVPEEYDEEEIDAKLDSIALILRLDEILTRANASHPVACDVVDLFLSVGNLATDDIENHCDGILGDAANRMALEMHAGFSRNPATNETAKTACGTYTFDGRRWTSGAG